MGHGCPKIALFVFLSFPFRSQRRRRDLLSQRNLTCLVVHILKPLTQSQYVKPGSWSQSNVASRITKNSPELVPPKFVLQNAPEASTTACPSFATFNTSRTTHASPVQEVSNPSTSQHPRIRLSEKTPSKDRGSRRCPPNSLIRQSK